LTIRRKLVLSEPGHQGWRRDLSISYERVGQVHQKLNETKEALDAYKSSLALRQGLADANPGNAQLQGDLAVVLYLMSTVSDAPAAKDALTKALAILEALERDKKLTAAQVTWPNFIRGELAKLP
jgi:hypothetical protein